MVRAGRRSRETRIIWIRRVANGFLSCGLAACGCADRGSAGSPVGAALKEREEGRDQPNFYLNFISFVPSPSPGSIRDIYITCFFSNPPLSRARRQSHPTPSRYSITRESHFTYTNPSTHVLKPIPTHHPAMTDHTISFDPPPRRSTSSPSNGAVNHRASFAENLRHSPRSQRHPSFTQAAVQELLQHPPVLKPSDPRFAGRDWRSIHVGELVQQSDVRWIELDSSVEEATKVCTLSLLLLNDGG